MSSKGRSVLSVGQADAARRMPDAARRLPDASRRLPEAGRCAGTLFFIDFARFSSILVGFQGQLGQGAGQSVAPDYDRLQRSPAPLRN